MLSKTKQTNKQTNKNNKNKKKKKKYYSCEKYSNIDDQILQTSLQSFGGESLSVTFVE